MSRKRDRDTPTDDQEPTGSTLKKVDWCLDLASLEESFVPQLDLALGMLAIDGN